ncbi:MAG: FkbM family methyltransferase [Thermaurantimonas sp.]
MHKILSGLKTRYWKTELPVVQYKLGGGQLKAIKGTIRTKPDKDDAWLFRLMGDFHFIYDIGANIGQSALYAKIQNRDKQLLLVDANPEALSLAAKNLIINGWSGHCTFECAFVGERSHEKVQFFTVGAGAAGSMYKGHAHTAAAIGASTLVPTITLDDLWGKYGWLPEFVKIDVEGAEAKVLQGATQLAAQQRTWFMVEMHSPPELPMKENASLVLHWCRRNSYRAWYMRDAAELTAPEQIQHRGRCHLLLMPQHEAYPEKLSLLAENSPIPDNF